MKKLTTLTQKSRYDDVVFANPDKKRPLPAVAHNYSFWANLIFAPGNKTRGLFLIVEGTSRFCWCHPFKNKNTDHMVSVVKAIDENRMPCNRCRKGVVIVTDTSNFGKEHQIINFTKFLA